MDIAGLLVMGFVFAGFALFVLFFRYLAMWWFGINEVLQELRAIRVALEAQAHAPVTNAPVQGQAPEQPAPPRTYGQSWHVLFPPTSN